MMFEVACTFYLDGAPCTQCLLFSPLLTPGSVLDGHGVELVGGRIAEGATQSEL